MHTCPKCGSEVDDERRELLGIDLCIRCTPQHGLWGIMDFSHKTAGVLMLVEDYKLFKQLKKPINQQR